MNENIIKIFGIEESFYERIMCRESLIRFPANTDRKGKGKVKS